MKYAVIDIGSNTIRMSLFNEEAGSIKELLNKKSTAGLASYVKSGYMTQKGIDKLIRILNNFLRIAYEFDFEKILMFATASLRNIENKDEVLSTVEREVGHKIDLIDGEREALYGYVGLSEEYDVVCGTMIDIGGGSTEITIIKDGAIAKEVSLPEGSLSLFTKYSSNLFPKKSEIKDMKNQIRQLLKPFKLKMRNVNVLYGAGGTARAAGNIAMELNQLPSNRDIPAEFIYKMFDKLISKDKEVISQVLKVAPDRIHTIIPGLVILVEILRKTGAEKLLISKNGIREGYLISYLKE